MKSNNAPEPALIVVSGPPASGKTTVAKRLARSLGLPRFSKDDFKELLFDHFGVGDREWSRTLGGASVELLVEVAAAELAAGVSVVVESTFVPRFDRPLLTRLAGAGPSRVLEVFCSASDQILLERFRHRIGERHAGHLDAEVGQQSLADALKARRYSPLRCGGELLILRTEQSEAAVHEEGLQWLVPRLRSLDDPERPCEGGLVVMSGLPGTGKSTIAEGLGRAMRVSVHSKDRLEASLLRSAIASRDELGGFGYDALTLVAKRKLCAGQTVILDSVASTERIRSSWRDLAQAHSADWRVIECVCSDPEVHRRRMVGRRRGIPGWPELDWTEVEAVRSRYVAWNENRLELDACRPLNRNLQRAKAFVTATG